MFYSDDVIIVLFRKFKQFFIDYIGIYYYIFAIINETAGTFTNVAKSGYMSTITPNPNERIRLITLAELLTGYMGEDLPRYIMGVLIDLVNNKVVNWKLSSVFMIMGGGTALISSLCTFWFFMQSKERVPQSIEKPSIKEGMRAIVSNYPVLLMCLSEFLGNFSISKSETNYFIDVLGSYSLITLLNIPSSMNGSISYSFVAPLRRKFSSKSLWIFNDIYNSAITTVVFLFGMTKKKTMFKKTVPMCIAFGLKEWFIKWSWGISKVINADLWNEAMDYCEWKNGYRTEAMTSVARDLTKKLASIANSALSLQLKKLIGYDISSYTRGEAQTDNTKFGLFAMATIIPTVTGLLGIVPILFYDLSGEKRERMYAELLARREEDAKIAMSGDKEAIEKLAKEQLSVGSQNKDL